MCLDGRLVPSSSEPDQTPHGSSRPFIVDGRMETTTGGGATYDFDWSFQQAMGMRLDGHLFQISGYRWPTSPRRPTCTRQPVFD